MSEKLIKRIISEKSYALLLVKGRDSSNESYCIYLLMKDSLVEKFQEDYAANPVCLDNYGKVIFGIPGNEVDTETEQKVLEHFRKNYLNG